MNNNNQSYDMIDEIIDAVIEKSDDKIIEAEDRLLDERLSGIPDVSPSADFEKRMSRIFAVERRKQRKKTYTKYGRIAAVFAAAVLVVSVISILSVDAWRMKFYNKFISRDDISSDINLVESTGESSISVENVTIQYIPEGFVLDITDTDNATGEVVFFRFKNTAGESFSLNIRDNISSISINTEDADVKNIMIRGHDAILSKDNASGENIILYNDDKYSYAVSGDINVDELINIANGFSKK